MSIVAGAGQRGAGAGHDLVEQLLDPVGQHRHLRLLERHRDQPGVVGDLQVERPIAGHANGARDEPSGPFEEVELARHGGFKPTGRALGEQRSRRRSDR